MDNARVWSRLVPELSVTDFEESRRFYIVLLGFTVWFERGHAPNRFVYLEREGAQIMLEELCQGIWQTGELIKPFGRGVNFQIECGDLRALANALADADYPLWREPREEWRDVGETYRIGSREFLVQDPDGYLLRFTEDLGRRLKSDFSDNG